MKSVYKNNLKLSILLLSIASFELNAKSKHRFIHDDLFAFDEFEDMFDNMREQIKQMRESMLATSDKNKEEREAVKQAHANLSKIKPEISHDDNNVYIKFKIDNIDKNTVDIQVEDNKLHATIPTKDGKIEFSIANNYLELSRSIEIKKEEKDSKTNKSQAYSYFGSSSTTIEKLPQSVDLTSVKADTKDNELVITLARKKQTKIKVN